MSKNKIENLPIIVIEGPSGVGKDSVFKKLIEKYPQTYIKMPSVTSREKREGEIEGETYFFVNAKRFEKMVENKDVFEFTTRHGTYRGMSKKVIENIFAKNLIPLKDCDQIGINALKKEFGSSRVLTVFLTAPREEIINRLKNRGDSGSNLEMRIKDYDEKIKEAPKFDVVVENIVLDDAVNKIHSIVCEFLKK